MNRRFTTPRPHRPGTTCFLVVGWLILSEGLFAQAVSRLPIDFSLRRWLATEDLRFSAVEAITQTRDGFLWFAMNGGLGRFDGVTLEVFDSATAGLPVSYVTSLAETPDGSLWFGTAGGGLLRFREGRFLQYGESQGLQNAQVKALSLSPDGRLWIATDGGGLFVRDTHDRFHSFGTNVGLPDNHIAAVKSDEHGRIVVLSSKKGPYLLQGERFYPLPLEPAPKSFERLALTRGFKGQLWLGGDQGIYRLDGGTFTRWLPADSLGREKPLAAWEVGPGELWLGTDKSVIHWKNGSWAVYPTGGAVSVRTVGGFEIDHEGSVWISTEGAGLVQLRPTPAVTLGADEGLAGNEVTSVLSARDGSLWVATSRGLTQMSEDGIRRFSHEEGLPEEFLYSLQQDAAGDIWIATRTGTIAQWDGHRFSPLASAESPNKRIVWCLAPGAQGTLWAGTTQGAIQYRAGQEIRTITGQQGLSNDDVRCVWDDGAGTVWFGTSYGLNRLTADGLTTFTKVLDLDPIEVVISLHLDRSGILWIGTMTHGLFRLKDGQFSQFSAADGLPSDSINSITEDESGNLWLGTGRGLVRLIRSDLDTVAGRPRQALKPLVLGRADGLRSEEFNGSIQPTSARDATGRLWFATADGLSTLQPNRLFLNHHPPQVSLQRVALEGADKVARLLAITRENRQLVDLAPADELGHVPAPAGPRRSVFSPHFLETILIPPGQERLDIQFVGPSFIAPKSVTYRYKLENFDSDWVESGTRRAAYYTRVPPGKYIFRVQASNEDGFRGEPGAELTLVVAPFWWQRTAIRILGALLLLSLVGLFYQFSIRRLRRRSEVADEFSRQLLRSQEKERARLAGELHDGLGQELQLIRNRAELALLRQSPSPELARELSSISGTASRAISGVRALSRGLRPPELDQLGLTQALRWLGQNARDAFAGTLEFRVDLVDGLLEQPAEVDIYRIAQESLTNALKHSGATEITFEVGRDGGELQLSVFDRGRGFITGSGSTPNGSGQGSGLKTMKERAVMLRGTFEIRSVESVGTRLTLRVPVPNKPASNS